VDHCWMVWMATVDGAMAARAIWSDSEQPTRKSLVLG
jgi:hypothetical protein